MISLWTDLENESFNAEQGGKDPTKLVLNYANLLYAYVVTAEHRPDLRLETIPERPDADHFHQVDRALKKVARNYPTFYGSPIVYQFYEPNMYPDRMHQVLGFVRGPTVQDGGSPSEDIAGRIRTNIRFLYRPRKGEGTIVVSAMGLDRDMPLLFIEDFVEKARIVPLDIPASLREAYELEFRYKFVEPLRHYQAMDAAEMHRIIGKTPAELFADTYLGVPKL
ncbi:hypothetical protein JXB02_05350 [Candidatus Woesearchaeota archaeon]|nr:hypothetical protein [Candidatus Woesearchaeota archaeon]